MDWFLYDNGLRHERVNKKPITLFLEFSTRQFSDFSEMKPRCHHLFKFYTLVYISNIFISNVTLKLAENEANTKQHLRLNFWQKCPNKQVGKF